MDDYIGEEEKTPQQRRLANLENGKATQFGGERANPQAHAMETSNKPWSIRNCLKNFANREFDYRELIGKSENEMIEIILAPFKKVTLIQVGAARQVARYAKACIEAQYMTDQIDGKLAQMNLNAEFAALQSCTEDQLHDIVNRFNSQSENSSGPHSSGSD